MPQIYITAIITTVLSLAIIGGYIYKKSQKKDRGLLLLLLLIFIPIYFAAFYLFRIPLDSFIKQFFEGPTTLYLFIAMFYAPLTEETFKLPPFLAPKLKEKVTESNKAVVAFTAGLGFGIGEMWLLAQGITKVPQYAEYPWYLFTGFIGERFFVCFIHGALILIILHYLLQKKWRGFGYAMLIHWAVNFPILFKVLNLGNLDEVMWGQLLSIWLAVILVFLIYTSAKIVRPKQNAGRTIFGQAKCPKCGEIYDRPLIAGFNLVFWCYERCGKCKKFNLIGRKNKVKPTPTKNTHPNDINQEKKL